MTFTTGGPPPAGITWQALIFKSFGLSVDAEIVMDQIPNAKFSVAVTPSLGMRPPSKFRIQLSPMIAMSGGSDMPAAFGVSASPLLSFGKIQSTALRLSITPVFSMAAKTSRRSTQINVAVTRSATR